MTATSSILGALRVVLGADTAGLEKGLKDASSKLTGFVGNVGKHGAAAGLAVGAALTGAIGVSLHGAFEEADKLGKMAQSVGMPVEELSKLKHAADLSDVSLESLSTSMGRLNRNMAEAASDPVSKAGLAFKALGIEVKSADGTLKSSSVVLGDIAEKFSGYKDGAAKSALAIELFGRSGAAMIPMLNAGRDGLQEMADEAGKLGLVIDHQTAKAAENFNDNLTRLGKVKDGVALTITAQLAPAMERLSQAFVDVAKDGGVVKGIADGLLTAMNVLAIEIGTVVIRLQGLGAELSALWKFLNAPIGTWKSTWAEYWAIGDETERRIKALGQTMSSVFSTRPETSWDSELRGIQSMQNEVQKATEAWTKGNAPLVSSIDGIKKAADEAEKALKKILDAGKRTFEQTRTPAEQFALTMQKINEQYNAGAFGADTYARAVEQAQEKLIKAQPAAQALGNALMSTFDKAFDGGMKFKELATGLARDLMKMAASAIFRQFLMGGGVAGGTGIIGNIFSLLPGFATGGSFTVGGSGGIDSQVRAMRLTPGEQVRISRPGEDTAQTRTVTIQQTFSVSGAVSSQDVHAMVRQGAQQAVTEVRRSMVGWQIELSQNGQLT